MFERRLLDAVRERPIRKETAKEFIVRLATETITEVGDRNKGEFPDVTVADYDEVKRAKSTEKLYSGPASPLEAKLFDPALYEKEYAGKERWGSSGMPDEPRRARRHSKKQRIVTPLQAVMELGRTTGTVPFLIVSP